MKNTMQKIINANAIEALKTIDVGSVDLVVTDPPYCPSSYKMEQPSSYIKRVLGSSHVSY